MGIMQKKRSGCPKAGRGARVLLWVLCGILFLSLGGCGGRGAALPDLCRDGFRAELVLTEGEALYRMEVTVAPIEASDGSGQTASALPDATVTFLAPDELAGLTVTREKGEIRMECGGTLWEEIPADGFFLCVELLLATDGLTYVCDTERGGETLRLAESYVDGLRCERYLTVPDGIPRLLRYGDTEISVLRFEAST